MKRRKLYCFEIPLNSAIMGNEIIFNLYLIKNLKHSEETLEVLKRAKFCEANNFHARVIPPKLVVKDLIDISAPLSKYFTWVYNPKKTYRDHKRGNLPSWLNHSKSTDREKWKNSCWLKIEKFTRKVWKIQNIDFHFIRN